MWPFDTPYPEKKVIDVAGGEYDYIIVGGGTAGCAIASRLSEDPAVTVLLLEKGPVNDDWLSRVPLISSGLGQGSGTVYRTSEPDEECRDRAHQVWHAEALGGTSRINAMLWTRGTPGMYNEWAAMGHPDWSWDKVEPYFKKIEDARSHPHDAHWGHSGPVQTLRHESWLELHQYIDKSAAALGLPIENDANNPQAPATGYFSTDYTIDSDGHRHSALRAYLPKSLVLERQRHLTICTSAVASRLEVDSEAEVVTGVYYKPVKSQIGVDLFVKARREVIICSGAFCSPQLLQLSGVGPSSLLKSRGITIKRDLPGVGAHLTDHCGVPVCLELPPNQTFHLMENYLYGAWHLLLYLFNRTGWMKSSTTNSTINLNTSLIDPDTYTIRTEKVDDPRFDASRIENVPDIEVMVVPASVVRDLHPGKSHFSLYVCLVQPLSHGRVEIASRDPELDPTLYFNILSNPKDLDVLRKALRFTLNLAEHFMKTSGYPHPVKLGVAPNAESGRDWRDLSNQEIDDYIRGSVQSALHLGCTCRMAREEDGGVVDDELRVYGFKNLRIADASVFPKIPAAHTMAPTYMVAERCADFVKATWEGKTSIRPSKC